MAHATAPHVWQNNLKWSTQYATRGPFMPSTEKVNVCIDLWKSIYLLLNLIFCEERSGGRHICCWSDRSRMCVDVSSDWYPGYAVWFVILL